MQYAAIQLCQNGGVIRHETTDEIASIQIGDFDSMDAAIQHACSELNCYHLCKGVMSKGRGRSGYLLMTQDELKAI